MTRAVVLQHFAIEEPYAVGEALERHDVEVECLLLEVPDTLDGVDAVVSMGGPQDAYADHHFPSRHAELAFLRAAVQRGIPVLGVCLGAQMLALAAGGDAVPGDAGQEVGWAPVRLLAAAADDALLAGLGDALTVLHWHGDTVVLPPSAPRLASSDRYPNQAYRVGERAWGLQFHIEVTLEAVAAFVERFRGDPAILDDAPRHLAALEPVRNRILDRFAALVTSGPWPAS